MTNYTTVDTRKDLMKTIKTIWNVSGIVTANESPIYKVFNRTEILLRSLQMIRLLRRQERINSRLNRHAAILETMNCTISSGPEYEYVHPQQHECRCECAFEDPEDHFFRSPRSSGEN